MKKIIVLIWMSSIALFCGSIDIEVFGIENQKGSIFIGLFNSKENFPKKDAVYKGMILEINSKVIKYQFADIPNGAYAVSIFQDKNNNGKLDKNFIGIPSEKYGFSNNARGSFSSPSFDEAKFEFVDNISINVEIK